MSRVLQNTPLMERYLYMQLAVVHDCYTEVPPPPSGSCPTLDMIPLLMHTTPPLFVCLAGRLICFSLTLYLYFCVLGICTDVVIM